MEQLYPCPEVEFAEVLRRYPGASQVVWVQEEPRNMGAWSFVRGYIQPIVDAWAEPSATQAVPKARARPPGRSNAITRNKRS